LVSKVDLRLAGSGWRWGGPDDGRDSTIIKNTTVGLCLHVEGSRVCHLTLTPFDRTALCVFAWDIHEGISEGLGGM
jgi:hypothetical protein